MKRSVDRILTTHVGSIARPEAMLAMASQRLGPPANPVAYARLLAESVVDVVKRQVTSERQGLRGTLVGLRCPSWVGTLNVAGYHWHFLSEDRKIGGHVIACDARRALVRYDTCETVVIRLPDTTAFESFDAGAIKKQDIDQIERQRTPAAPQ